jgi:uncharacterized protein (TIGR02466 family)
MNIEPIFYNFVATDFLKINNSNLETYCRWLRQTSKGRSVSNYGGWQSNDLDLRTSELSTLFGLIAIKLNEVHKELGLKNSKMQVISNIWANINDRGSFNVPHLHASSCFSGVYYVKGDEKSGSLKFRNPNLPLEYAVLKDDIETPNGFNSGSWKIIPEPGKLVIFPSWLLHYVEPSQSDEDRISISFNSMTVDQ